MDTSEATALGILESFGWDGFFAVGFPAGEGSLVPARVVAEHRSDYRVQTALGELPARLSGRLRHAAQGRGDLPAVGDWVAVTIEEEGRQAVVREVLPRRTKFARKRAGEQVAEQVIAANVDVVWLVSALHRDLSLRRLERYLTLVWESGAAPVIVLTKADLCERGEAARAEVAAAAPGVPVHIVSALTGDGLAALGDYCRGNRTIALLGSSGVGKSTLINRLLGEERLRTGAVREKDGKGRHTTTHRQLIRLPQGGLLIDTPGMRELHLWEASEGVQETFADLEALAVQCRFADCRHQGEPGCAILAGVESGAVDGARAQSYRNLLRELNELAERRELKARAERTRQGKVTAKGPRSPPKSRR